MIGFLLINAVVTVWVALNMDTSAWMLVKSVGFYAGFAVFILLEFLLIRFYFQPRWQSGDPSEKTPID
jgi:hypothetical protein